jgi:hypothetical protein
VQAWTAEAGHQVILPDSDILAAYEAFCGYNPTDPATDQGGVELDVLAAWRKTGVGGHTIGAYATLSKRPGGLWGMIFGSSWRHAVANSVFYFGSAYIGVALPETAQGQNSWELVSRHGKGAAGSWGGHAVPIVAYDKNGVTVITWGELLKASWDFLDEYMDEGYVAFSNDILNDAGKSPEDFALTQLQTDLNEVTA